MLIFTIKTLVQSPCGKLHMLTLYTGAVTAPLRRSSAVRSPNSEIRIPNLREASPFRICAKRHRSEFARNVTVPNLREASPFRICASRHMKYFISVGFCFSSQKSTIMSFIFFLSGIIFLIYTAADIPALTSGLYSARPARFGVSSINTP